MGRCKRIIALGESVLEDDLSSAQAEIRQARQDLRNAEARCDGVRDELALVCVWTCVYKCAHVHVYGAAPYSRSKSWQQTFRWQGVQAQEIKMPTLFVTDCEVYRDNFQF